MICLTCGAGPLIVLAALVMLQAAEVTGTLLTPGVNLTTTSHTAALGDTKEFTNAFFSVFRQQHIL